MKHEGDHPDCRTPDEEAEEAGKISEVFKDLTNQDDILLVCVLFQKQGDGWTDHPEPLLTCYPYILPREWPWPGPDVAGRTPGLPAFLSALAGWVIGQLISLGLSSSRVQRFVPFPEIWGFPGDTMVKNLPANSEEARDMGSMSGLGWSSGEGNGNPFQYSCLKNPMDRGAWWTTVCGVTKNQTWLTD